MLYPTWHLVHSRHSILAGAYFSEPQGWEEPLEQLKVEKDEFGNPSALGSNPHSVCQQLRALGQETSPFGASVFLISKMERILFIYHGYCEDEMS